MKKLLNGGRVILSPRPMKSRVFNPNFVRFCKNVDGFNTIPGQTPFFYYDNPDDDRWTIVWLGYHRKSDGKFCTYTYGYWDLDTAFQINEQLPFGGSGPIGYPSGRGWTFNFNVRPVLVDVQCA